MKLLRSVYLEAQKSKETLRPPVSESLAANTDEDIDNEIEILCTQLYDKELEHNNWTDLGDFCMELSKILFDKDDQQKTNLISLTTSPSSLASASISAIKTLESS